MPRPAAPHDDHSAAPHPHTRVHSSTGNDEGTASLFTYFGVTAIVMWLVMLLPPNRPRSWLSGLGARDQPNRRPARCRRAAAGHRPGRSRVASGATVGDSTWRTG